MKRRLRVARRSRPLIVAFVAAFGLSACLDAGAPVPTPTPAPATEAPANGTAATSSPVASVPVATAIPGGSVGPDGSAGPDESVGPDGSAGPDDGTATLPSPTPRTLAPGITPEPRGPNTLIVIAPAHPTRLLPPARNPAEALLVDVLYDPLYRLDVDYRPVPAVARDLPEVSDDGRLWKVPIRVNARFHDGRPIRPEDVEFTLRLAASPVCPLGRELCSAIADHVDTTEIVVNNRNVEIPLFEAHSPFLAEGLARLPILSESAVTRATRDLLDAADRLGENRPDRVIADISDQLVADACVEADAPSGCRLTDHRGRLESVIRRAGVSLPSREPYTDEGGLFDEERYTSELLDLVTALAQLKTSTTRDQRTAALSLVDITENPLGSGPYRLRRVSDSGYVLVANEDHPGGPPNFRRLLLDIERNGSEAVTRLVAGEADWILDVGGELATVLEEAPGVTIAPRPLQTQRGILFNVRPDRLYHDVVARRAFAACLDRDALAAQLDTQRAVATTPFVADGWATPAAEPWPYDPAEGNRLLDAAGWELGADGVRVRDGVRLSSSMAVRPSRVEIFTAANLASAQLAECGIELVIEELDLTGDTMLNQLQWPNDFDTLLLARRLGVDPDSAVRMFESSRITSEDNEADANPSGFTSAEADFLIAHARTTLDAAERAEDYAGVQRQVDDNIPYWPLWYDTSTAAISDRIVGPDGPIDPSRTRYAWDIGGWRVEE